MARWQRLWSASFVAAVLATAAVAQAPKTGPFYKNTSFAFEVKVPADWEQVPPDPNEKNLIVKYDPAGLKYVPLGTRDQLFVHCWLLKFDRRKKPESEDKDDGKTIKLDFGSGSKDLAAWIKKGECGPGFEVEGKPKEFEVGKVKATEYEFLTANKTFEEPVKLYAVVYHIEADLDLAMVFNGPAEPKKWTKWRIPFAEMGKSFRRVEIKESKPAAEVDPSKMTLRDKTRAEWITKLKDTPEWKLYETPNYFVVSCNPDKAFLDELMGRLEAIRTKYEEDYPYEKMQELKKLAATLQTGEKTPEQKAEEEFGKLLTGGADPREMSRCSIVRVCKDAEQYYSYGGPGGSAGYWSPMAKELVLYDDRKVGGKGDTWAVLNHEGFHQFIFYFYGNISPHSWYNEGTGDFYSGYQYKAKRFTLEKFQWRVGTIKTAVAEGTFVPLKEFVRWSQAEYYGQNKLGVGAGQNYAQGWSFIYFLRTGKKANAKGWDPKWDGILEAYLKELAMTNSTDKAVEKAFEGIDMDALEEAWKAYTK